MKNSLICLEGTLKFDEEVRTQTINVVAFRTGQQITINRDRLAEGQTLGENIALQVSNAEKIFNQFNLVKMEEVNDGHTFTKTFQVIYSFITGQGGSQRVWQVTYACLLADNVTINFTSIYPDEVSMKNEIHRLAHCVKSFTLNNI